MIAMKNSKLVFSFPEVHEAAQCSIEFQRTLRIPDDNRRYPLPPGLGAFSMGHVEDHASRLPAAWATHGGVLLPVYQAEAMWIYFHSRTHQSLEYPFAIKIAAGKFDVVTGEPWTNELHAGPQDYVVVPEQPWLDGFSVGEGMVRQFVAMPLGAGYTAEEQLSGEARHGGLQIIAYPMKREYFEEMLDRNQRVVTAPIDYGPVECDSMGLAPGGLMSQEIYDDPYGLEVWDTEHSSRCFVHLLNSEQWRMATGAPAPGRPPSAKEYTNAGLPWFDYYNENAHALKAQTKLKNLDGIAAKAHKLGDTPIPDNDSVTVKKMLNVGPSPNQVVDGKW